LTDTYIVGDLDIDSMFSGSIADGPDHALKLLKVGTARLTLSGASTYSGGTVVSSGSLIVNNSSGSGTGSGTVTVQAGAMLGGNGSLGGDTTIEDGGILSPGTSAGTLTFNGDLSLNEFSVLQVELGTTSDRVVVQGNLFAAGTVELADGGGFGPGTYTLFNWNTNQTLVLGTLTLGTAPAGYNYSIDTSAPGRIDLVVTLPTPSFAPPTRVGNDLILSGSGGVPGADYHVLTSTNLALPMTDWLRLITNQFDGTGNFLFTNSLDADAPRQFLRLEVP